MTQEITAIKRLAPEDIAPGAFIVVTGMIHELIPPPCDVIGGVVPIFRVPCLGCADGDPLRVLAVCIPFVMVEDAQGDARTLDTRQHMLARVDEMYALEFFTRPDKRCNCND